MNSREKETIPFLEMIQGLLQGSIFFVTGKLEASLIFRQYKLQCSFHVPCPVAFDFPLLG